MRPRLTQLVALLACVALVGAAASTMSSINAGRQKLNIMGSESPLENTPPEYVFYIQALGAFRGLVADIAFLRADRLKEQGRYYDAMQVHQWICALQPQFPSVWEYAAWNMAWNISVTTFTAEERWNWVYNGVKLLRDQGIPRNPRALNLYKQLAWIFNNKMSEPTDDQHRAYKCYWAWRMHLLLGPPPDPYSGLETPELVDRLHSTKDLDELEEAGRVAREQTEAGLRKLAAERGQERKPHEPAAQPVEATTRPLEPTEFDLAQRAALNQMQLIADAPRTLAELYARDPDTTRIVAELRALGIEINDKELTEDDYWCEQGLAFTLFKPYRELLTPATTLTRVAKRKAADPAAEQRRESLDRILGVRAGNPAGADLIRFLQRKVLLEVYKLDPAEMGALIREFGPMDWRSVDSQGLYWNVRGLIVSGEKVSQYGHDKLNTARDLFFCLHNLFARGHIVFEPDPENIPRSYISFGADLNFIEAMHQAYIKYGPLFDADAGVTPGAGESFRSGHINLLTEGIRLLYLAGREADAAHYYNYLRTTYGLTPTGKPNGMFAKSLDDFVLDSFLEATDTTPSMRDALYLTDGWLFNAYEQLADGNATGYVRLVRAAESYHEKYMREKRNDPGWAGKLLPAFGDLQIDTFGNWLARPSRSVSFTLHKVHLWQNAPLYLRQPVYDALLPAFKAECDYLDFDVARAFPEPADMDKFRQQHPERYQREPQAEPESQTLPRTPGG
jgi:hypothetical protein